MGGARASGATAILVLIYTVGLYFINRFGKEKAKNALLPVKLTFTTLGVGGFVVGRALNIPYIPWLDGKGYWQITDITQKIDDTKKLQDEAKAKEEAEEDARAESIKAEVARRMAERKAAKTNVPDTNPDLD